MKKVKAIGACVVILLTAQYGYATCSEEWVSCRKEAREFQRECKSSCEDSGCRRDCDDDKISDYESCDEMKSECRSYEGEESIYSQPQKNRQASVCQTNFGSCPMMVSTPVGSSCYCMTPAGQIWGIAQ